MKRILYILLAIVIPSLSFGADQVQALFAAGNASYNKGQYKEALDSYKKVVDEGYESASLYFNMGNASYKNGDIPSALLYYGKAHKLSPGDEDINFNIKYVNLKTTDKIDEAPEFFITRWWRDFILAISANALGWISVLLVLGGSGLLIWYFFTASVSTKRASFYAAMSSFTLGLIAIFMAGMQVSYFSNHREAIVFSSTVNVNSGPVEKAKTLFVIHEGTRLDILDESNDWIKIKLANGSEGWIKATDVKEI